MAFQQQAINAFSTKHLHADLRGRSVRGGMLTLTSQGAQFLIQSVATVVLARLLVPAEYGLVAMVTAITGLGQAFADLGLSEATIQHPEISHEQVSTLFWINVGIGAGLMSITAALAPLLAWFYREPRLVNITLVCSLTFLIGGLRVQHDALLRRQMRFISLAIRDVTSYAIAVPFAIVLAWRGASYWALVALPLTLNFTGMAITWLLARWIPGPPRRNASVRSLISFGGSVAASYLVLNVTRSADSILIGWHWGAGPLGLYSRAYNLLMLPVRQLGTPARAVAVPAFSRVQDDPERLARYYLRAVNVIMWVSAPIFGYLFVAADPVIVLTLGSRWREAAPVFQLLAIFALGQLLMDATVWLFVSRGKSLRLLQMALVLAPIMIGSYALGLPFGIRYVALCSSVVLLLIFPGILKFSFRGTRITLRRLGQAIFYPVLLCLIGASSGQVALHYFAPSGAVAALLVTALGFTLGCLLSLLLPQMREDLMSLWSLLARSRSVPPTSLAEIVS